MLKQVVLIALATAVLGLGQMDAVQAAPNLVVNGDFESLTNGNGEIVPGYTTGTYITSAPAWYSTSTAANGGYPFLFFTNNAVTTGFNDAKDNGVRYVYGASNGGQNGNTWNGTSPVGGYYLVADGDYNATPISQAITGLVTGQSYALSFSWAAGQFVGTRVQRRRSGPRCWGVSPDRRQPSTCRARGSAAG